MLRTRDLSSIDSPLDPLNRPLKLIVLIQLSMPLVQMRLALIAAKDTPLTAVGRNTADPASKLLTNEGATPTQTEMEEILPLAV
jgi:hypothetical protein